MSELHVDVQRLVDRESIRDVLARYFSGIDAADSVRVRSCFADDVRAAYDGRTFVDGIEALMDGFLTFRNRASGAWLATTHFMGNLSYLALDSAAAETEVYAIAFLVTPGTPGNDVAMRSLRYLDRWRKSAGEWRIRDRVHTLDWSCSVPVDFVGEFSRRLSRPLPAR